MFGRLFGMLLMACWAANPAATWGQSVRAFGLLNEELGAAELSLSVDGSLIVSGLASSADGVAVHTAGAQFGELGLLLDATTLAHDAGLSIRSSGPPLVDGAPPVLLSVVDVQFDNPGGGFLMEFTPDFTGLGGSGDYEVRFFNMGVPPAGHDPLNRPAFSNFTAEFVDGRYVLRAGVPLRNSTDAGVTVLLPSATTFYVPGEAPIEADAFLLTPVASPAGIAQVTQMSVRDLGTPGATLGSLTIDRQALGLAGRPIHALGDAHLDASASIGGAIVVSNIGSTGLDGIGVTFGSGLGKTDIEDVEVRYLPPPLHTSPGSLVQARAVFGDGSGGETGAVHVQIREQAGELLLESDFTHLGATSVIVAVYDQNGLVGSAALADGSLGSLIDAADPVLLSTTALDTDGNGGLDILRLVFSEPIRFRASSGISLTGEQIDLSPDAILVPPDPLLRFESRFANLSSVTLLPEPTSLMLVAGVTMLLLRRRGRQFSGAPRSCGERG